MGELNRYLYKLKLLKGTDISASNLDTKNLPDDIIYDVYRGNYIKIDSMEMSNEDIDLLLKVKNTYNFNMIKKCVTICTVFFVIAACAFLYFVARVF